MGVPGAATPFLTVGWCLWRTLTGVVRRRDHVAAPLAASAAGLTAFAHGPVDFFVYTPAVTFTLAALLRVGRAQSFTHEERRGCASQE